MFGRMDKLCFVQRADELLERSGKKSIRIEKSQFADFKHHIFFRCFWYDYDVIIRHLSGFANFLRQFAFKVLDDEV